MAAKAALTFLNAHIVMQTFNQFNVWLKCIDKPHRSSVHSIAPQNVLKVWAHYLLISDQTCFCMWLIFYEKRRWLRVSLCSSVSSSVPYKSTKYFRNSLLQLKPELLLKRPNFKMFPSTSRYAWHQDSITQHQGDFNCGASSQAELILN